MKISPINFNYKYQNIKSMPSNVQNPISSFEHARDNLFNYPAPSFLGYTLNLFEVNKQLGEADYPNYDVFRNVRSTLKSGNQENKTLYDVHFETYKGVLDYYSLDELKNSGKYPEFDEVVSAWDVKAEPNSFIGEFQRGVSSVFEADEDLSLQLIKLYWGRGYSLNQLTQYIIDNSSLLITSAKEYKSVFNKIYHTIKNNLKIPRMTPKYAGILKLSNKDYNKQFALEMSKKSKRAAEARAQRAQGEPVVIPENPENEAETRHTSKKLLDYFENNPEKINKKTKRQKAFYEKNPELSRQMSLLNDFAWNRTQEGRSIKKYLSKFMQKFYKIKAENFGISSELSDSENNAMQDFWDKNPWAKSQFSAAFKKAREYYNKVGFDSVIEDENLKNGQLVKIRLYPKRVIDDVKAWARKNGYDVPKNVDVGTFYIAYDGNLPYSIEEGQKASEIITDYFAKSGANINYCLTAQQVALISLVNNIDFSYKSLPHGIKKHRKEIYATARDLNKKYPIYQNMQRNGRMSRIPLTRVEGENVDNFTIELLDKILELGGTQIVNIFQDRLENSYNAVERCGNQMKGILKFLGY